MQILNQNNQEKINNTCDRCGKEINNTLSNRVIKLTYGNMINNTFLGKEVRYYHVECVIT